LSELEGDYEFEKIGICCEWTEYKSIEAVEQAYSKVLDGDNLEDNTTTASMLLYSVHSQQIPIFSNS
jgi:hypothetical protein